MLGIGASPGITNVLARYAADHLDRVDTVHISTGSAEVLRGRGGDFPYSLKTTLSELLDPAVVYRNGQYLEVPALSGQEIVHSPLSPARG